MKIDFDNIKEYIYRSYENEMRKIICKYNDDLDKIFELEKKLAISEAKIYSYEKIIANSNFKAILEEKESKGEDNE